MSTDQPTEVPSPAVSGLGAQFAALGLILSGAVAIAVAYYVPLVRIGARGHGKTYSLSSAADFGAPEPAVILGGAIVLALVVVWVTSLNGTRAGVAVVLSFAVAEALIAAVLTATAVALLPGIPSASFRSRELSWGPALWILLAGVSTAVSGALWWCLQVWTSDRER